MNSQADCCFQKEMEGLIAEDLIPNQHAMMVVRSKWKGLCTRSQVSNGLVVTMHIDR